LLVSVEPRKLEENGAVLAPWKSYACLAVVWVVCAAGVPFVSGEEQDLSLGKEVYERACLECHGEEGHGDGETARERKFRARDYARGAFKCRCTPNGELPTDEDLARIIMNGIPGTPMRNFDSTLTAEEIEAVIGYVKALTPRFAKESAPDCIPLPEPVAATAEMIREGAQIYRILRCWTCHGVDGKGRGPAARGLQDDWGDRIRVYDFTREERYKCGGAATDLYRLLHTGMNGSPMPSFGEAFLFPRESVRNPRSFDKTYDQAEIDEIMAYMENEPDMDALASMTPEEKDSIRARRTWALVHYLRSLSSAR
jgi:cytochrome c oxidase cbb3-type subunit 2